MVLFHMRRLSTCFVQRTTLKGFDAVREQFEKNFARQLEENAQLCVYYQGQKVVDLRASSTGHTTGEGTSTACIFSSSKVLESICIATLVDRNLLQYSDKVIQHWPEYASSDSRKESITIADVLRHEGGMPTLMQILTIRDIQRESIKKNAIGKIIEREKLSYPSPRAQTKREYHAFTRGLILNEIFRRVDPRGRTIGECLKDDIADPLGVDTALGLNWEQISRSSKLSLRSLSGLLFQSTLPKRHRKVEPNLKDLIELFMRIIPYIKAGPPLETLKVYNVNDLLDAFMHDQIKTGELPSVNAESSAYGLAKIAAMVANGGQIDGIRILSEETIDAFQKHPVDAPLHPLSDITSFTQGGVNVFKPVSTSGPLTMYNSACRNGWMGWLGLGGSVFQWHPQYNLGFGYVPTFLAYEDIANTRGAFLQQKVVECVEGM